MEIPAYPPLRVVGKVHGVMAPDRAIVVPEVVIWVVTGTDGQLGTG